MPINFGKTVNHFSLNFNTNEVTRLEGVIADRIRAHGIPDPSDYFSSSVAGLPWETRQKLAEERLLARGIPLDVLDTATDPEGLAFRVLKEPGTRERGYGVFNMPREIFVNQRAANIDEMTKHLSVLATAVNIEPGTGAAGLSQKLPSIQAARNAATQMADARDILGKSRAILDVETGGLTDRAGIWQVSARKYGPDGLETANINLRFVNNTMDVGDYTLSGTRGVPGLSAEEFISSKRPDLGGARWLPEEDFATGMKKFFDFFDDVDYIAAHNLPFDVRQLEINTEHIGRHIEGFEESRAKFLGKVKGVHGIDTRMLALGLMEHKGGLVNVAENSSQVALSNLMTNTSFYKNVQQDMIARGLASNQADAATKIQSWLDKGLHFSDVDTYFEGHLLNLQLRTYAGEVDLLAPASDVPVAIKKQILEEASITPHTHVVNDEVLGKLTPIQIGAINRRNLTNFTGDVTTSHLRAHGSVYGRWFDEITTGTGEIRKGVGLMGSAIDEVSNMPFSGLSPVERYITTAMGQAGIKRGGEISRLRQTVGSEIGSGMFRQTKGAKVYSGRNIAISPDILRTLEARDQGLLSSKFSGALADSIDDVQTARLSTIKYTSGGVTKKDVALVADIFEDQAQAERFGKYILEHADELGIPLEEARKIRDATKSGAGLRYGVQVGIMGEDAPGVNQLYGALEGLGMGLDDSNNAVRVAVYDPSEEVQRLVPGYADKVAKHAEDPKLHQAPRRVIGAGPALIETVGDPYAADPEVIRSNLRGTRELEQRMARELPGDNQLADFFIASRKTDDLVSPRPIYNFIEKHMHHVNPRNVGIGIAAMGLYYLFGKSREQQPYDETTQFAGYEDPGFYESYKEEMGEYAPGNYQQRHLDTLATARVVQTLDNDKIRHHQMSARDRNNHLFGGVM